MRDLKFNIPTRWRFTSIEDAKRDDGNGKEYYSKFRVVATKKGVVTVLEMNWETNRGRVYGTDFMTVVNGYRYSATLNEANLSDRQLKWLATNFINKVFNNIQPIK